MKNENQKHVGCDSRIGRLVKRKLCAKSLPSNIHLNLISVSILPRDVGWTDMESFVTRRYGPFTYHFRNEKDEIIAGIRFHVSYHCKGQYKGKGYYLAEATITPFKIFARRGYELICNITASDPMNYGTKENPIAGFVLKVQMQVRSKHPLTANPLNSYLIDIRKRNQQITNQQITKPLINKASKSALNTDQSLIVNSGNIISRAITRKRILLPIQSEETNDNTQVLNSCPRKNKVNVEEQHLSVLIRGDGQVYLLSDYI